MDTIFRCHACGNVFAIKPRRGRPPKHCDNCKKDLPSVAEQKRQKAADRVDRLTRILEARGLSIKQQE